MATNYNDSRLLDVKAQENQAKTELGQTYDNMISQSDNMYQQQIDAVKDYANTQKDLQQQQTDFTIEKINQQKEQAEQDYTKEQRGAYVDWQKQSDNYGVNAEKMAQNGLQNSGYSESSQVSMYTAYQNRVSVAREGYNRAVLNYDNAIKDAMLQNSSALAEIAYNTLQKQLELSLEGFQYKNNLVLDKISALDNLDNKYHSRYQEVLSQINTENSIKASNSKKVVNNSSGNPIDDSSGNPIDDTTSNNGVTVDMNSVISLGYGPISEAKLNQLVSSGEVIEELKGNKLVYRKATSLVNIKK